MTTIQKLNNLIKSEADLSIYNKQVVFINFEFKDFFISDGIRNNIRVQFTPKYRRRGLRPQGIFRENRRAGEPKLVVLLKSLFSPYQIAATERILWKIISSYNAKKWRTNESGGYIWHTTGSCKTLTSFKGSVGDYKDL